MTENERIENDIRMTLSLRKPQADSLEILAKVAEVVFGGGALGEAALPKIQTICPSVKDFDRDFCSLCFVSANVRGKNGTAKFFFDF